MFNKYIFKGCERLRAAPNLSGDIAVTATAGSCIAREAAGLVKIHADRPGDKKGTVHAERARKVVIGIGEKIDDIQPRDLTQFFHHPLSTKFIGEIKALRDRARACAPFILPSLLVEWSPPLSAGGRSEWTIEPRDRTAPNERKSGLANLWVPAAASAGRFTARYINGWFHPRRSIARLV